MKKAIVVLLLVLCMATLFAATIRTQTITLVSVVEEVRPCFVMEVVSVENGYYDSYGNEAAIYSCNVKNDVKARLNIVQTLSRFTGTVDVKVSFTELTCNGFSTSGAKVSGSIIENHGRSGGTTVSDNAIDFTIEYNGKAISESVAAEVLIEYNGNSRLPEGEYVSYVMMSCVVR